MICPSCFSTSLIGPRSLARSRNGHRSAVMSCVDCSNTFDAYAMYGAKPRKATTAGRGLVA